MTSFKKVFSGYSCFWRIESFTSCKKSSNFVLKSPTFHVASLNNSKWYLEIQHEDPEHLGIYLFLDEGPKHNGINFSICLLTDAGWTYILKKKWHKFKLNNGYGIKSFISWNTVLCREQKYVPDGTLTVSFLMSKGNVSIKPAQCFISSKIVHENQILHQPIQEFSSLKSSHLTNLSTTNMSLLDTYLVKNWTQTKSSQTETSEGTNMFNDFEDLLRFFKEKKFTYVTLRTKNKEFLAHKALLCSRSPVFNAMFERDMKENESNVVNINDIDEETLSTLMQFLHLEALGDLGWDSAIRLYYAADKYEIGLLREKCVSILVNKLSAENVCETLILADMHQDDFLKNYAKEYFFRNSKTIIRSSEWKSLTLNRIDLASEILSDLSEYLISDIV